MTPEKATRTRGIHESSFAGVTKKTALTDARDENVGKAIVVVISDGHAHSVHLEIQSGILRHVGKSAVAVVAVELQSGTLAFVTGPVHAVHKKDVLPAVAVVVEKRAARAQRFREQLATIGAAIVLKVNSNRIRNIGQTESKRCGWICECPGWRGCRGKSCAQCCQKEITPLQGRFTNPFRIA